ncbi:MAG TPA: hypothetical protein VLM85_03920 [Polyangiaceae bacterium]|nr:hypothetical protein [Polyangiaceae bacterium]
MKKRGLRKFREQAMAKRMGMQKLKRRFAGHGPAALPLPAAVAEAVPMPILAEIDVVTESGTYPAADHVAGDTAHEVTLVVYGWQNVQPGTLSWVFPSFDAAMKAANALRNATQWAILDGNDACGPVLAERNEA